MEKAKAFGKNLLWRATGAGDTSEEEEGKNQRKNKASYSEVVTRSPGRRPIENDSRKVSVKTRITDTVETSSGNSSGKTKLSQKLFSAEDVAKLVEIARNQLRKEAAAMSGWTEAETKEKRRKEKLYARELVQDFQRSPESEPVCWQCNKAGHLSSSCPRGERCFICNSTGHKRAECPSKRRATAAEKGKGIAVESIGKEERRIRTGGPLRIGEEREVTEDRGRRREYQNDATEPRRRLDDGSTMRRPEAAKTVPYMQKNQINHDKDIQRQQNDNRKRAAKTVFMAKSEGAMKELSALEMTGGVLSKANGNPTVKDFIDALKRMCSSYAEWNWKPIPINQGTLFQFPSIGGLDLLTKRSVIPCNNGHFTVAKWEPEFGAKEHNFPTKVALLAFNIPPFLRGEADISRMIEGFAHLIEATQLYEEGGPMKLVVGCRSRDDVPKEIPIVFGGKEYTVALAVREIVRDTKTRKDNIDLEPVNKKRSKFTYLAPSTVAGDGENKEKKGR